MKQVILKDGENVIWKSLSPDEVYDGKIEIQRLHIAGMDLTDCDFQKCQFLADCSFEGCQLNGCDFSGALLTNCIFDNANASSNVNWQYSMVMGASFKKTKLKRIAPSQMFNTKPNQFNEVIWVD